MVNRGRRVRNNAITRSLIRETRVSTDSLILPLFIKEGKNIKEPIISLNGHFRYSIDTVKDIIGESLENGVNKFLLFGIPDEKDECGSDAYYENGIVQKGLRAIKEIYKDRVCLTTDVCMCEYTSHGHCGILKDGDVDNDETLTYLDKIAVSHALNGADIIAPSDMMDNRIKSIRNALDNNGFINVPIMSYSVKYSSSFYGPFREAVGSAPSFGDRKSYQMDFHNKKEALKEMEFDIKEGADILMVKPALSYLDIISNLSCNTNLPIAAYSVSGEYAMIKQGGLSGIIDEYKVMCETSISMFRAGANILISYYANDIAKAIKKGDIG